MGDFKSKYNPPILIKAIIALARYTLVSFETRIKTGDAKAKKVKRKKTAFANFSINTTP